MYYELTDQIEVKARLEETWAFFSRAENLPEITPPALGFRVVTAGPIELRQDSEIDYVIRWMGVPIRWRTRIIDWSPPGQFIDLQIRGPYSLWHHQHRFVETAAGTTVCRDRVIYRLPMGWVGRLAHPLIVRRQLVRIFEYRRKVIGERVGLVRAVQEVCVRRL